jgi:hypothetical protein
MTVRDYLVQSGFMRNPTDNKTCCPFHDDRTPSAMVHDHNNTIWCFSCQRLFGPNDFRRLGVTLDVIQADPALTLESRYAWGEPLFYA